MKRAYSILLLTFAAGFVLRAADPPPTGEAILDKYIEVTGGKAAYEKVQSQVVTAVMEFVGKGVTANLTMYHAAPAKSYSVAEIEGIGKMEEGTDGSVVWERSAIKGPRIKTGEERALALRSANLAKEVKWRDFFKKVEYTGAEPVDGKVYHRVALTPNDGQPETRYYDRETGLLYRTTMIMKTDMGEIPVEMTASDFRKVDGILVPFVVKNKVLGQELSITIKSIKNNVEIEKSLFAVPEEIQALNAK